MKIKTYKKIEIKVQFFRNFKIGQQLHHFLCGMPTSHFIVKKLWKLKLLQIIISTNYYKQDYLTDILQSITIINRIIHPQIHWKNSSYNPTKNVLQDQTFFQLLFYSCIATMCFCKQFKLYHHNLSFISIVASRYFEFVK